MLSIIPSELLIIIFQYLTELELECLVSAIPIPTVYYAVESVLVNRCKKAGLTIPKSAPICLLSDLVRPPDVPFPEKVWIRNANPHRDGMPAVISRSREIWLQKGELHCTTGPALIEYYMVEKYGSRGYPFRYKERGPVRSEKWYQNGLLFSPNDGPCTIHYSIDGIVTMEEWP